MIDYIKKLLNQAVEAIDKGDDLLAKDLIKTVVIELENVNRKDTNYIMDKPNSAYDKFLNDAGW